MRELDMPWQSPIQLWTHRDATGQIVGLGSATLAAATKYAEKHATTCTPWKKGEYLSAAN